MNKQKITPGNHETYKNYSLINSWFHMPLFEKYNNHFYSLNIGYTHFVIMNFNFYDDYPEGKVLLNDIEKDLKIANENRNSVPWIVFISHIPFYCSFDSDGCKKNWEKYSNFENIIYKYKVDLVVNAHEHIYER